MDRRCSLASKKTLSALFVALSMLALPVTAEPTKPLETHHALMGQVLNANQQAPLTGFALHVIVDDEPTTQVVVAGAVTQQKDYAQLEKVMSDYLTLQAK